MSLTSDYITPIVFLIIEIVVIGGFLFLIFKGLYVWWTKSFKYVIKYKILRKDYDINKIDWCNNAFDNGISIDKAKMLLLLNNNKDYKEMLYILKEVYKERLRFVKGGIKNGQNNKGNFGRKTSAEKFPAI